MSVRARSPLQLAPASADYAGAFPEGSVYWNPSLQALRVFSYVTVTAGAWQNAQPSGSGASSNPPGSTVMSDSLTAKVGYTAIETIAQTDSQAYNVQASYTETNATPTDALKANVSGPGFTETNTTPVESLGAQLIFVATSTFTPSRSTTYTVVCRGAGAGGAKGTTTGGTGGNGGDYATSVLSLTAGTAYPVTVGAAGAANGGAGGDSWVGSTATILAKGGGSASTTVGTTKATGTAGAAGQLLNAGGAGGAGANGGGAGGAAAANGTAPGGGGGGGAGSATSPGNGGSGGQGQVTITWTAA